MGWLGDFLFGKGDKSTTTPTTTLSTEQQAIVKRIQEALGQPVDQFAGEMTSPLSGLETMSLDALENMINTRIEAGTDVNAEALKKVQELFGSLSQEGESGMDAMTDLEGVASETLKQIMQASGTDIETYLNAFNDSATADFNKRVLPGLDRKFANRYFSSDRQNAENMLLDDFSRTLATTRADLGYKTATQDALNKLNAAGIVPQFEQNRAARGSTRVSQLLEALGLSNTLANDTQGRDLNLLFSGLEGGGIERAVADARLKGEFDKFALNSDLKSNRLQEMLGFIQTPTLENIVTVKKGKKGLIPAALEGFVSGASSAAGKAAGGKFF